MIRACACAVLALLAGVSVAGAQEVPSWSAQHGAFAYADETGVLLLTTAAIDDVTALKTAFCAGAPAAVAIRFERRQDETPASTGRQTPANFANTRGIVFRLMGSRVEPAATCFLAAGALSAVTPAGISQPQAGEGCSRELYPRFEADKGRPVVGCWPIAATHGVNVVVVEFARRLTHALAALVVVEGTRRLYVDYPAEFAGPGADLWRADDGGEIHPEGFSVVSLLRAGSSFLLTVDWPGAEAARSPRMSTRRAH